VTARGRAREEVSAGGVVFRYAAAPGGDHRPVFLLIRDSYQNWGFPKGHLEAGEGPECAALREVTEETGLGELAVAGQIETIDWYFRFRGRLIHKVCHFFLMRTQRASTCPQRSEGITACRWAPFEEAVALVSYANAREVLRRAHDMVCALDAAREVARATEVEVPVAAAVVRDADGPARRRRRTRRGRRPGPRPGNPEAGPPR
jgi:8-oxo-dGTP pyrophosphatase MutT (NUDIX family)